MKKPASKLFIISKKQPEVVKVIFLAFPLRPQNSGLLLVKLVLL